MGIRTSYGNSVNVDTAQFESRVTTAESNILNHSSQLADIVQEQGDITQLNTTDKSSIVNAIKEVKTQSNTNATNITNNTSAIQSIASGAPKAVSLVSQMTDTTKNYVYTGSEGGYTTGHWYYYNGSAWVSGGIYQSTGLAEFPATNLVTNGNFASVSGWTPQYGSGVAANNEYEYTVGTLNSSARVQQTITATTVGHIYYMFGFLKPKYANIYFKLGGVSYFVPSGDIVLNDYKRYNCLITATASSSTIEYHIPTNTGYVVGDKIYLKYVGAIDLTVAFGAGKEPTLAEMELYMSKFTNSFFDGINGQLISFKELFTDVKSNKTNITSINAELDNIVNVTDMKGEIVRPKAIPCVVGKKLNIHFDNILMNQRVSSLANIDARNLASFRDFALINPADTTQIAVNINARFGTEWLTGNGTTTIIPVATSAGSGLTKKCLFIGDSITNDGRYENELVNLFASDAMHVELLGTEYYSSNILARHEGKAGWAAEDFVTKSGYGTPNEVNPFWNGSAFDFAYYMTQQGYTGVDYVFINLGTNDTVASRNYTNYAQIISYYNTMINSIKAYNSSVKVFIGMTILQTTLVSDTYDQRNIVLGFIKALKTEYEPREGEGIYLVPNYVNVDPQRDFNYSNIVINDRTTDTVKSPDDKTHPNLSGHQHLADIIYSYIKYIASLG